MAKSGETLYKDQTIFYEFSSTRSSLFPLVSHLFSKISQVSFLFLSPELLLHPITLVQSTASIQVQLSPSPMDPFISKLSKVSLSFSLFLVLLSLFSIEVAVLWYAATFISISPLVESPFSFVLSVFLFPLHQTRKLHLSHSLDFSFILSASHSARSSKPSVTLAPISTSFRRI
ncbi:hypothetical protein I3842_01G138200 [Carya illinoinensis]|uniref:Uncharacterized protein n=1 Tax=Carya illinoinensis TaxID=32201 RepID=A0A922K5F1_CARIL|nr:hypothetical protein I3842_01G138200 [Carya illinoinensis]